MQTQIRPCLVAATAGLALSAAAHAQFGVVSNQPGSFTDIRTTGTVITSGDDNSVAFTSSVTNALVPTANLFASTNGNITSSSFGQYSNDPLPAAVTFGLFPFWDDLFVDGPGLLVHRAVVEGGINVEVIQWSQVRTYSGGPGGTGSFEIKLFASGPVYAQFLYQDMTFAGNGNSATIGAQWSSASYDQYSFNTASVQNGTVLSIVNAVAGRCCLSNGTCATMSQGACAGQGGVYGGDGTVCSGFTCPTGACCVNSTCVISNLNGCVQQGGTYRGDGVTCAVAPCPGPVLGPDVWVGDLTDVANYGAVGAITAYAVGTTSCNLGDYPVDWYANINHHPVIAQNMARLMNGRFEQIGQSWLKHGFSSTNSSGLCGTCIPPSGGGQQLGIHCSDTYGSGLNGGQGGLGPRSEVNATTGAYPYPFGGQAVTTLIDRRLQVFTTDVTPAANSGALYFVEGHYVTYDDAGWNNGLNNSSYRRITMASETATPQLVDTLHSRVLPIQAWKDQDPSVTLVNADYSDNGITARFGVAGKATNNGNGTWHYEYAVYNHNADRSAGSFSIPVGPGITLSNTGFHAPFSHSGEPFSNAAWTPAQTATDIVWSTTPFATNANANAIRWGTLYNFRFDASTPPTTGAATLGIFKPGTPTTISVPGLPVPTPIACYANCDNSTTAPALNVLDFSCFLNRFAAGDSYANCDHSTVVPVLNVLDFACFLNAFAAGCP